jgi:fermentation-respiration switch protein FrsA (DUF1100 family)
MKRKLMIVVIVIAVLLPVIILIAGSLLSRPVNQLIGELPTDIAANQVEFSSESGTTVRGWFIRGKENFGAVILMHGVRANRLSMLERARFLARAGYSVLLFDFQAHGESKGENITFGYLESKDARAAVSFVRLLLPKEKIGVVGVSMGGAAFLLAKPKLEVDAVVLEMVYPTIEQAVSNRITERLGGWATILTPLLTWQLKPRLGISAAELRPIDYVGVINSPKLFIAGANDKHTTLAESNALFAAASAPKELWIVPDAAHVDLYSLVKEEYEQRLLLFFEKYLRQKNDF